MEFTRTAVVRVRKHKHQLFGSTEDCTSFASKVPSFISLHQIYGFLVVVTRKSYVFQNTHKTNVCFYCMMFKAHSLRPLAILPRGWESPSLEIPKNCQDTFLCHGLESDTTWAGPDDPTVVPSQLYSFWDAVTSSEHCHRDTLINMTFKEQSGFRVDFINELSYL